MAGKYVDLHMPPEDGSGATIPDGGTIGLADTTTAVEFDQFLSIFDEKTRGSLKGFIKGQNRQYAGRGEDASEAFPYLSPSLGQTASLFRELGHDQAVLERFLVDTSRFVTALADRDDDLSAVVGNLDRTTGALAAEREALAQAISAFPGLHALGEHHPRERALDAGRGRSVRGGVEARRAPPEAVSGQPQAVREGRAADGEEPLRRAPLGRGRPTT